MLRRDPDVRPASTSPEGPTCRPLRALFSLQGHIKRAHAPPSRLVSLAVVHPQQYRLRDVLRAVLLPQLLYDMALYISGAKFGPGTRIFRVAAVHSACGRRAVQRPLIFFTHLMHFVAALRAVPVPCVRGKWSGNLDVVLGFVKSLKNEYLKQFLYSEPQVLYPGVVESHLSASPRLRQTFSKDGVHTFALL